MSDPQANEIDTTDTEPSDLAEDALVEEVSIDGMCGVY
jgi:mycofactocin precursor